jgi:hypothetical protein
VNRAAPYLVASRVWLTAFFLVWKFMPPDVWAALLSHHAEGWLRGNCCYQAWLLKKSIFLKTAEIWGIENVYPNRESRL